MRKYILLSIFLGLCANLWAADITQEYRYQVLVKQTVLGHDYQDAIYYTPSEWASLKQADVNAEIQKRTDNYVNAVQNPAPAVEQTKEQMEGMRTALQEQVDFLTAEIAKAK